MPNLKVSKALLSVWSSSICLEERQSVCYDVVFVRAFRARNMRTKCGVIFPPTSRRSLSSKSRNCLQSTVWVKVLPPKFLHATLVKKRGIWYEAAVGGGTAVCVPVEGRVCKCEQLRWSPAEPWHHTCWVTQLQIDLAPPELWILASVTGVADSFSQNTCSDAPYLIFFFFKVQHEARFCWTRDCSLCFCVSPSRTATTATRTDLRFVTCATWSSPHPWWLSRTTRAKFTPRTWDWSPLVRRLHVCVSSVFRSFPFQTQKIHILSLLLLFSSSLSDTSSSAAQEETSRGVQERAGRRRRRRGRRGQQRLQPFLLHVPGVVQQPAHGPAALRRQEAQKTDDQD